MNEIILRWLYWSTAQQKKANKVKEGREKKTAATTIAFFPLSNGYGLWA